MNLDDFYEYAIVDGVGQMAGWLPHENKEKSLIKLRFLETSAKIRIFILSTLFFNIF